jgi:ankyrin repeat protein
MVRLLVSRFQDAAYQEDGQGNTPLIRIIMSSAASRDRYESAKILLLHGKVDVSSRSHEDRHTPLRVAVRLGDLDMCRLLVQVGTMDPLSALTRDHHGQMALKDETVENEENVLAILQLLSRSAKTDAGKKHHH